MRVARWKVMAGGLLLSAGGLMAVADGPPPVPGCQPVPLPCLPPVSAPPAPAVVRVSLEAPVVVPAPSVAELPPPVPALPPAPAAEPAPPPKPAPSVIDTNTRFPAPPTVETLAKPPAYETFHFRVYTAPAGACVLSRVELRDGKYVAVGPDGSIVGTVEQLPATPLPGVPVAGLKLDNGVCIAAPVATAPVVLTFPEPGTTKPQPLAAQIASNLNSPPSAPDAVPPPPFINTIETVPAAAPAPAVPADKPLVAGAARPEPAPATAEKRLKVVLSMGDDRPRFEVRDGDETYLKVVSDRVEVKSAADKADAATMKAGGKVAFVTPGGDGTCDELAILPGSGQVVATGNVAFRHTWGRSETTVTAERMTFRLAHPGPTAIQAGYSPVK